MGSQKKINRKLQEKIEKVNELYQNDRLSLEEFEIKILKLIGAKHRINKQIKEQKIDKFSKKRHAIRQRKTPDSNSQSTTPYLKDRSLHNDPSIPDEYDEFAAILTIGNNETHVYFPDFKMPFMVNNRVNDQDSIIEEFLVNHMINAIRETNQRIRQEKRAAEKLGKPFPCGIQEEVKFIKAMDPYEVQQSLEPNEEMRTFYINISAIQREAAKTLSYRSIKKNLEENTLGLAEPLIKSDAHTQLQNLKIA